MAGSYSGTTYQQIMQAVEDYYGSGSDQWQKIYNGIGGYYSAEAANLLKQVPGVNIVYSNSGKVLEYSYSNAYTAPENVVSNINSNVQSGLYGPGSFSNSIPSTVVDNGHGQLVAQSGSKLTSSGVKVATVADRISLAATGVSLGTKLGKAIDSALYSLNPEWWDTHYPAINPETWDNIATTQGGRQFIQALFGLQGDNTTMYLDERLLAQTYMMLLQAGAYSAGVSTATVDPDSSWLQGFPNTLICSSSQIGSVMVDSGETIFYEYQSSSTYTVLISEAGAEHPRILGLSYATDGHPTYKYRYGTILPDRWSNAYYFPSATTLISGTRFYESSGEACSPSTSVPGTLSSNVNIVPYENRQIIGTILFDGTLTTHGAVDGINDDPHAQTYIDPTLITGTTLDQVLQQLKQNYPQLFDGSIYQDVPQSDGTVERITYIPVPFPQGITSPTPTTGEKSQSDTSVNPNNTTEDLLRDIIQILSNPETGPQTDPTTDTPTSTTTPPTTGDGDTPIVPLITGSASSLWKIYNPTQGEIDAFGAWLWSSNFIDQIKKLFNDPMQAIIGVHKVFCTPAVGGTATIKCGYLDSEISSNWVSNQYTHIDCGTVSLPEYFGNVFDYDPFTRVSIFIPCVGIVPLDVAEVMRSKINVKLHCDVLTGALLAEVNVIRDQAGGILYTYSGSCIVTYPVSSGSYIGAVANVVTTASSVAAGIMGTVASGGALAPAAVGAVGTAVSGLARTHTNVQHSGSFSGAAGVMGGKIPYLIITRPQTRMADQYPVYDGVPANYTAQLSECSGYVKVKEVHLKAAHAYKSEIVEIEQLLHQGILI